MYMECLECYFVAVDVANIKKQRAILLSCCGATMYGRILGLAAPSKPTAVPYPELVKRITAHFNPDRPRLCHNSSSAPGHSSLVSPLPPMCLNCGSYLSSVSMVSPWMTCCVTVSCGLAE